MLTQPIPKEIQHIYGQAVKQQMHPAGPGHPDNRYYVTDGDLQDEKMMFMQQLNQEQRHNTQHTRVSQDRIPNHQNSMNKVRPQSKGSNAKISLNSQNRKYTQNRLLVKNSEDQMNNPNNMNMHQQVSQKDSQPLVQINFMNGLDSRNIENSLI